MTIGVRHGIHRRSRSQWQDCAVRMRTIPEKRRLLRMIATLSILASALEFVLTATGGLHRIRVVFVVAGAVMLVTAVLLCTLSRRLAPGPAGPPPPDSLS